VPSAREDYLLRMIAQAAEALRRVRERLAGGANAGEVVRDAGAAIGELLGTQRSTLDILDARSAVLLVGDRERITLWVSLLRVNAEAERARHNDAVADRLDARADALEQAASRLP
jgi:hypothetical protein